MKHPKNRQERRTIGQKKARKKSPLVEIKDFTLSKSNVIAQIGQLLCATGALADNEEITDISFPPTILEDMIPIIISVKSTGKEVLVL